MKILIDESLPRHLKRMLFGYQIRTVQEIGWGGIQNGELLKLAEPEFEVFLTADKICGISRTCKVVNWRSSSFLQTS